MLNVAWMIYIWRYGSVLGPPAFPYVHGKPRQWEISPYSQTISQFSTSGLCWAPLPRRTCMSKPVPHHRPLDLTSTRNIYNITAHKIKRLRLKRNVKPTAALCAG